MITVDLLEPVQSKPEYSVNILRDQLLPIYLRYWQHTAVDLYDKNFAPHIQLLVELWFSGGMRLVVAKENDTIIGFAVCMLFRPMQYQASVLQVHDFFAANRSDVAKEMFAYIESMARMLNCDELWFDEHCKVTAAFSTKWASQAPMVIYRFTKAE